MTFHADLRHWPTLAAFQAHLAAHPPVPSLWGTWRDTQTGRRMAWQGGRPSGVTLHHTWRPLVDQWSGQRTIEGIRAYYRDTKGWSAGPHLFVVMGSPNPANDGIWQLTPLNLVGIHAGLWNYRFFGLEVVGDYDRSPWPMPVRRLTLDTLAALFRWMGWHHVTLDTLRGHRECGSAKSCPGAQIDMDAVRSWLHAELL
jgi:hypothetical protein